jgi:protein-tyrosine kinase
MSRIHEALKKAQQERAANPVPEGALTDNVLGTSVATSLLAEDVSDPGSILSPSSRIPAGSPSTFFRFEDLKARCTQVRWHFDPNIDVFFDPSGTAPGAEQFRTLRSRLYQLRGSQPLKILLVTSSLPLEGKTFVASNLAQAIVRQPDRRALIIDADMRRSRIHTVWGAAAAPGLSDYLSGVADEVTVLQHSPEAGNLCLLPSGSPVNNPSELLLNGRMNTLLDRLTPVFDWVIIDSPPCLPVADSTVLADLCDGVLLVVKAAATPLSTAQRARQELQSKKLLGVVLNGAEDAGQYGTYSYYESSETVAAR